MGLGLFVRCRNLVLPRHDFDRGLLTEGCDFCKWGKETVIYTDPELMGNSEKNKARRRWMKRHIQEMGTNCCSFTFFPYAGIWVYDIFHYTGHTTGVVDRSSEETRDLLDGLLEIPKEKAAELAKRYDMDVVFYFDCLIKWLKIVVKHNAGLSESF